MSKEKYGVHIAHCYYIHGCKYGDEDCPVASGEVAQQYLCYDCDGEDGPYTLEEIELLRKTKSYRPTYEQLKNKIAELETKLAECESELGKQKEKYDKLYGCYKKTSNEDLKVKYLLAEENEKLKQQLAESEKKHLLDEIEWQDYCAFKHIEPQIKGCLDREREYEKQLAEKEADLVALDVDNYSFKQQIDNLRQQLAEKEKEIEELNHKLNVEQPCLLMNYQDMVEKLKVRIEQDNQDKISFCIEKLEKVKQNFLSNVTFGIEGFEVLRTIENQIEELKKEMK